MSKLQLDYPIGSPKEPVTITQPFGANDVNYYALIGLKGHPGQDLVALATPLTAGQWPNDVPDGANNSLGKTILAGCDGEVLAVEIDTQSNYSADWTVVLLADDSITQDGVETRAKIVYAHCEPNSFKVKVGDKVKRGDPLALCGSSGVNGNPSNQPKLAHVHEGLKPCHWETKNLDGTPAQYPFWKNSLQDNGFGGAVDQAPYRSGNYASSPAPVINAPAVDNPAVVANLQKQVTLLQMVVALLKKWFK